MKQLVDWIKFGRFMYIDIFYAKTCATTKISTEAGYHVVLAMLLFQYVTQICVLNWWSPVFNHYMNRYGFGYKLYEWVMILLQIIWTGMFFQFGHYMNRGGRLPSHTPLSQKCVSYPPCPPPPPAREFWHHFSVNDDVRIHTKAISEVMQMSLFWRILWCLPIKLCTSENIRLRAFEQNLFPWCTIHTCMFALANERIVTRHWKWLFSGCNPYLLLSRKLYKRITRKGKRKWCYCNFDKLQEELRRNQF